MAKGWTEEEFNSWWMRIMQDRVLAQSSIERCFNDDDNNDDDNNDDNNNDDDNNDDDNNDDDDNTDPEPPVTECSASNSEFIWGDNVVWPVKNQSQCGSCYAFSAMTVLEGQIAIKYNQPVQALSEQQVVDCQSEFRDCYGCNGGWPISLHQSTRHTPIVLDSDYAYTG